MSDSERFDLESLYPARSGNARWPHRESAKIKREPTLKPHILRTLAAGVRRYAGHGVALVALAIGKNPPLPKWSSLSAQSRARTGR